MSGGPGRKIVAGVVIGLLAGAVAKALRGDPAPQFANHPTVKGGPSPTPVPPAGDSAAAAEPETVVQATLLPVADVAADEVPAEAPAPEVVADAPTDDATADAAAQARPADAAAPARPADAAWAEPVDGTCPDGFPVKAKLKSGLFHLPGMFAYDRTKPDRCYATAADAEADGLRAAKR